MAGGRAVHLHTGGAPEHNITHTIEHIKHEKSTPDMIENPFSVVIKYGAFLGCGALTVNSIYPLTT